MHTQNRKYCTPPKKLYTEFYPGVHGRVYTAVVHNHNRTRVDMIQLYKSVSTAVYITQQCTAVVIIAVLAGPIHIGTFQKVRIYRREFYTIFFVNILNLSKLRGGGGEGGGGGKQKKKEI
jgi:hypothetical protein